MKRPKLTLKSMLNKDAETGPEPVDDLETGDKTATEEAASEDREGQKKGSLTNTDTTAVAPPVAVHLEAHFGPALAVIEDTSSELPRIDLHIYPPSRSRPHHTVATNGISRVAHKIPKGLEHLRFVELITYLPHTWEVETDDDVWMWPYMMMLTAGRVAHQNNLFLSPGTAIPQGIPYTAGSLLDTAFLLPLLCESESFERGSEYGKMITFLHVFPITTAEFEFNEKEGPEALIKMLDGKRLLTEPINPHRACAVTGLGPEV